MSRGPDEQNQPTTVAGLTVLGTLGPEGQIVEQAEFEEVEEDRPTVLLTGARTALGRLLRTAWADSYHLVELDGEPGGPDDGEPVDLATWNESWPSYFEGVDVVVHLDGAHDPNASWSELIGPELDSTANVLNAAGLAGVQRLVYASDWRVMEGHLSTASRPLTEVLCPLPTSPYGASKLAGERIGRAASSAFEMEFLALRLGGRPDLPGPPGSQPLSDSDLVALLTAAVEMEMADVDFLVIHAVPGWPMDQALERLGFRPHVAG